MLEHQRGRAVQINAGVEASDGETLLLPYVDTCVRAGFDVAIRSALSNPKVAAGAFRLRIDASGWPLRLIERGVDVRSRLFQMPYGDQGIFLRASLFRELGNMPRLPIMEDFELVKRLRKHGKIEILPCDAVPPQDYMAAKRFLRSVEYEIRNPSRSGLSLASNIVTDGQRQVK